MSSSMGQKIYISLVTWLLPNMIVEICLGSCSLFSIRDSDRFTMHNILVRGKINSHAFLSFGLENLNT